MYYKIYILYICGRQVPYKYDLWFRNIQAHLVQVVECPLFWDYVIQQVV